mmetsp:Transcript_70118/g.227470  ORF Transcript_70118/g.227470 Transcript_70118/m.227470 type:complete len:466 (+) Transcript_70118:390-1787(+)
MATPWSGARATSRALSCGRRCGRGASRRPPSWASRLATQCRRHARHFATRVCRFTPCASACKMTFLSDWTPCSTTFCRFMQRSSHGRTSSLASAWRASSRSSVPRLSPHRRASVPRRAARARRICIMCFFCTDCKRGGHGQLYCKYLLERPNWRTFPDEPWFQDQYWKEYYCPEGRRVVDFADEPQFSRIAMYLSGRVYLEDKTKLIDIACGHMPETFIIEKGAWIGKAPPPDDVVPKAPWFVKQADRNWGTSIRCCLHPSECLGLVDPANRYVVQQHVLDPFLTDDGRKCHVKFYLLLVGLEDGRRWNLYTYKDGYACISPHKWGSDDTSSDTQVTIIRSERLSTVKGWGAWPAGYTTCKEVAAQVVKQAVEQGKLEGRDGKKQFEIFSADFVLDTSGKAWLLEFNFDPVLRDDDRHASTDDSAMVRAALSIVLPWEQGSPGFWDFAGEFVGRSVDNGAGGEGA